MPTATLVLNDLRTYAAPARLYHLDPPAVMNGREHSFVVVWVQPAWVHQNARVCVVPANPDGSCALPSVQEAPGSTVLHADPDTPESYEFAVWLALRGLGTYDLAGVAP